MTVPFRVTEAEVLAKLPMFTVIVIGDRNGIHPGAYVAQKSVGDSWVLPTLPRAFKSQELVDSTQFPFYCDVVYVGEGLTEDVRAVLREGGFDV